MNFYIKDPGSAITHFIAMLLALCSAAPLLVRAAIQEDPLYLIACGIFIVSMISLYCSSTIYHTLDIGPRINKMLRKLDHMMIFILIAGTYTPICLIVLHGKVGYTLLAIVWSIAIIGMILKAFWITCPKWFSSVLYIAMGWVCVLAFKDIFTSVPLAAFLWLLAGGVIYTIGGVIYALKLPFFNSKHKNFGSHEIFHIFCMLGSACHFIMVFSYVTTMPLV